MIDPTAIVLTFLAVPALAVVILGLAAFAVSRS